MITPDFLDDFLAKLPKTYRKPRLTIYVPCGVIEQWNVWFESAHPRWAALVSDPVERWWRWWVDAGENVFGYDTVCMTRGFGERGTTLSEDTKKRLAALPPWKGTRGRQEEVYLSRVEFYACRDGL